MFVVCSRKHINCASCSFQEVETGCEMSKYWCSEFESESPRKQSTTCILVPILCTTRRTLILAKLTIVHGPFVSLSPNTASNKYLQLQIAEQYLSNLSSLFFFVSKKFIIHAIKMLVNNKVLLVSLVMFYEPRKSRKERKILKILRMQPKIDGFHRTKGVEDAHKKNLLLQRSLDSIQSCIRTIVQPQINCVQLTTR